MTVDTGQNNGNQERILQETIASTGAHNSNTLISLTRKCHSEHIYLNTIKFFPH